MHDRTYFLRSFLPSFLKFHSWPSRVPFILALGPLVTSTILRTSWRTNKVGENVSAGYCILPQDSRDDAHYSHVLGRIWNNWKITVSFINSVFHNIHNSWWALEHHKSSSIILPYNKLSYIKVSVSRHLSLSFFRSVFRSTAKNTRQYINLHKMTFRWVRWVSLA